MGAFAAEPLFQKPRDLTGDHSEQCETYADFQNDVLKDERRRSPFFSASRLELADALIVPIGVAMAAIMATERLFLPHGIQKPRQFTEAELQASWFELHRRQFYRDNKEIVEHNFLAGITEVASLFQGVEHRLAVVDPERPGEAFFYTDLIYVLPDPQATIVRIWELFMDTPLASSQAFYILHSQLTGNLAKLFPRGEDTYVRPDKSTLSLDALISAYFGGTPFEYLFRHRAAVRFDYAQRYEHSHIVGGTGSGKTTLLAKIINRDLANGLVADNAPATVVIDPHSDLVRNLARADFGYSYRDRLILIDPRDMEYPPAVNVFAINQARYMNYDAVTREQLNAAVVDTFDYFFTELVGAELTAKQGILFRYMTRLLLSFPYTLGRNATIVDMLRLTEDATPYLDAIAQLPDTQREFFERDFLKTNIYRETKEQIRYRLQSILENPVLSRFFTAQETKLDLFTEMNNGAVILIDTAKEFLKGGSEVFGRMWISLILQAIRERAAIPAAKRTPTFLYIDEAASYFDQNIDDLLTDVRKFNCGCVFSHQYLDQASAQLRASLNSNTGIKFASGLSNADARAMAAEMRTTPDFILSQPKHSFAAYFKGVTAHAVPIQIERSFVTKTQFHIKDADYADRIERIRRKVSLGGGNAATVAPRTSVGTRASQVHSEPFVVPALGTAPPNRQPWYKRRLSSPQPLQPPADDISEKW